MSLGKKQFAHSSLPLEVIKIALKSVEHQFLGQLESLGRGPGAAGLDGVGQVKVFALELEISLTLHEITKQAMHTNLRWLTGNLNCRMNELNNKWKNSKTRGGNLAVIAIWSPPPRRSCCSFRAALRAGLARRSLALERASRVLSSPGNSCASCENIWSIWARLSGPKHGASLSGYLRLAFPSQVQKNQVLVFTKISRVQHGCLNRLLNGFLHQTIHRRNPDLEQVRNTRPKLVKARGLATGYAGCLKLPKGSAATFLRLVRCVELMSVETPHFFSSLV